MTVSNFIKNDRIDINKNHGEKTKVVHGAITPSEDNGALMTPVHLTSTFKLDKVGLDKGYDYSRTANPTRSVLQKHLAELENGSYCSTHITGMASVTAVAHLLKAGDHIIISEDCYGGVFRLFNDILRNYGVEISFIDLNDQNLLETSIQENTKCIWAESPTNPLLRLVDIQYLSEVANKNNALLVVDNTFCSPVLQKPLDLGAHIVLHSLTKYINGHCDVLGGAVITKDAKLAEKIDFNTNALGIGSSAFDSWMIIRGVKTLFVRFKQQQKTAIKVAKFLERHDKVKRVIYPGLKSHPDYQLAKKQQKGPGAMIAFEVEGDKIGAITTVENTIVCTLAESLGGVNSLIEVPAFQSHQSMTPEGRAKAGISDGLIRLSIGLEDAKDLISDLNQALSQIDVKKYQQQTAQLEYI